jgi:chromosomal replication initiation ATPase DnaA
MDRSAFLEGSANAEALALVEGWPAWPGPAAVICGPTGSGKSHLASIWRERSRAVAIAADAIAGPASRLAEGDAALVEDIDAPGLDEQGLFHLLNLTRERAVSLLLTSRFGPAAIATGLPDLQSRLRAMPVVTLGLPDEALLRSLMAKLFADRQVAIEPAILDFIVHRMERSFAAARDLVARLDAEALAEGKRVTRGLAGRFLGGNAEE